MRLKIPADKDSAKVVEFESLRSIFYSFCLPIPMYLVSKHVVITKRRFCEHLVRNGLGFTKIIIL